MLPLVAGMAGVGLVKGMMDKKREEADRKQAAELARWSPWSGIAPNEVRRADVLGSTLQGGMSGAMLGQSMGMGGGAAGAGAAAPAAGASVDGTTGALPPMGDSAAFAGSPGAAAAQQGTFPQYYDQNYTSPWMGMKPQV